MYFVMAIESKNEAASGGMPSGRSLLIISFSEIVNDARVLKQVREFGPDFEVTTCGYGVKPVEVAHHVQIPDELIHWKYDNADLILHRYSHAYWNNAVVAFVKKQLTGRQFDAVLANDFDSVPVSLSLMPRFGVHADMHEYAPREKESLLRWRMFVGPFRAWVCKIFLPRCASVTTVSSGLAREYAKNFGIRPAVVRNAPAYVELSPSKTEGPIQLVHVGVGHRDRNLHLMIEALKQVKVPMTLDMYLVSTDDAYLSELKERAKQVSGVTIHDPVPRDAVIETLNTYDMGIHLLPPISFNNKWALPNKFFDYIQARLGMIIGPSPEMAELLQKIECGVITKDFTAESLAKALNELTIPAVTLYKEKAAIAAKSLSSESEVAIWRSSIDAMMG